MNTFNAVARIVCLGILMTIAGPAAAQQAYPNKPIRLIVPYPPGGSNNVLARLIAQKLTESIGQPVTVDNRPGGNTVIGSEAMVKSPPDGYTFMLTSITHVINPNLYPDVPFDAVKDFATVCTVASTEEVLVVHPSLPANDLREFIALAKSKPGQLNYSSSGGGNLNHLAAAMFGIMTGVTMQHIPYKGGAPALTDIIAGQVQLGFQVPVNVIPHIRSGRVKAIAITGKTRLASLPQVPTFAEEGLPEFEAKAWFGIFAPAGTPKAIIDKLSTEIGRTLALSDIKEKLAGQGLEPFISTPEEFAALVSADLARYAKVIKTANIKAER